MVFLISNVFDFPGFVESIGDNGETLYDEFFTELFVFGYTGGPNLYDWCGYEDAWDDLYVDSIRVPVFLM